MSVVADKIENTAVEAKEKEDLIPKPKLKKTSYWFKYKNFICSPRFQFQVEIVGYKKKSKIFKIINFFLCSY